MIQLTPIQEKIYNKCFEMKPSWRLNRERLKKIIILADTNSDGLKRVIVNGNTYLVPIEDIICKGIKGEEVPLKYKRLDNDGTTVSNQL